MWDFISLQQQIQTEISGADTVSLEVIRIKYLGKKGLFGEIYAALPTLSKDEKMVVGKKANDLRKYIEDVFEARLSELKKTGLNNIQNNIDVTIPGVSYPQGRLHILTQTIQEICGIFEKLGFEIQEGPEIESEFFNFDALNIPEEHPSRDGFDTFYVNVADPRKTEKNLLLRSQTSPVQIRVMQANKPPLAIVAPGKVYRPDAVDASHSFMFYQIEGLLVDRELTIADLKGTICAFCKRFFGDDIRMRFRPHFFPFTEPSAEVDISCYICGGRGCSVCGRKGWLEIMGCGMVHPNVFKAVNYPEGEYRGFAFGMGVERIAMLRYGIRDIRLFYENDQRFLKKF